MTMHPEWDVLTALNNILATYQRRPTITWDESHQDDKNKVRELTLDAILNIEADHLATEGLQSGVSKDRVPLDPMTCVQVHMQGRTITRDLKRTIRKITRTEPLMKYYMERFQWTPSTCRTIDWELFGWAYKTRIKKKFGWSNKYHLKNLPTGDRMKRRRELDDERCCSCGAPLETDDHLFQCPKRPQFRRTILAVIDETKPKIAPFLYQILYNGVKQYICKYGNPNNNDDDNSNNSSNEKHGKDENVPYNDSTVNFERVQ